MKQGIPVFHLKREARTLAREENFPLHEALRRVAVREGFRTWSLLVEKRRAVDGETMPRLSPGDFLVLAARPGLGKTLMSLSWALETIEAGGQCVFFTLEYGLADVIDGFRKLGVSQMPNDGRFVFDGSDEVCADTMIVQLQDAPRGTLVIVDYLQILDQRRATPPLAIQLGALKAFAKARGLIFVFLSQVDRSYDPALKPCPDFEDIRNPNAVDLGVFDKGCFMGADAVRFDDRAASG